MDFIVLKLYLASSTVARPNAILLEGSPISFLPSTRGGGGVDEVAGGRPETGLRTEFGFQEDGGGWGAESGRSRQVIRSPMSVQTWRIYDVNE